MPFVTRIALSASLHGLSQMPNHPFHSTPSVFPPTCIVSYHPAPHLPDQFWASHPQLKDPICVALGAFLFQVSDWPPDWSFPDTLPYP
eukprot:366327-Chlamydomonas_euryale.AAC.6